jgi:hypothetical protein
VVRQKHRNFRLCTVYLDGAMLDLNENLDDWFRLDAVFRVTS